MRFGQAQRDWATRDPGMPWDVEARQSAGVAVDPVVAIAKKRLGPRRHRPAADDVADIEHLDQG